MSRKIDLAGRRFDRLVVVDEAPPRRTPSGQLKIYWRCLCDCGTSTEVLSQNLRMGRVRSCGCLADDSRRRYRDLTGKRFGRLVAIDRTPGTRQKAATWRCACDCGAEAVVTAAQLTTGAALSCGCFRNYMSAVRRWRGDAISYLGMHDRLRSLRGLAKSHPCVDCGRSARDWSYNGGDPHERTELVNGSRLAFSVDPGRYSPRCRKCHKRYDVALRKGRAA